MSWRARENGNVDDRWLPPHERSNPIAQIRPSVSFLQVREKDWHTQAIRRSIETRAIIVSHGPRNWSYLQLHRLGLLDHDLPFAKSKSYIQRTTRVMVYPSEAVLLRLSSSDKTYNRTDVRTTPWHRSAAWPAMCSRPDMGHMYARFRTRALGRHQGNAGNDCGSRRARN